MAREVGKALHEDRLARGLTYEAQRALLGPGRTVREALGQGLLTLALRLAPELDLGAAVAKPAVRTA